LDQIGFKQDNLDLGIKINQNRYHSAVFSSHTSHAGSGVFDSAFNTSMDEMLHRDFDGI
jgi:hypothetical protein